MDRAVCFGASADTEKGVWLGRKMLQGEELTKPQMQRTKLIETPMAEDLVSGWQSEQSVKA
jgi:hypothetical protein